MKRIQDIEKLSAEDLLTIGADETVPVPEDLHVSLPRRTATWGIAAALQDTFDDPYLAYAAVEQALGQMSRSVQSAALKIDEAENLIDKYNYWK